MAIELSLPYIAGYFDAEGCIQMVQQSRGLRTWLLRISFGQTEPTVITALSKQYGGSLFTCPPTDGCKEVTYWVLTKCDIAREFLSDIQPFVREKRAEVELALTGPLGQRVANKLKVLKRRTIVPTELPYGVVSTKPPKHICSFANCTSRMIARGLCSKHYQRACLRGEFEMVPRGTIQNFTYRRHPTVEELQYIAGFFDGDGCVSCSQQARWSISFGQCRPEGPLLLHGIYDGVLWLKAKLKKRRPQLRWTLNKRNAILVFCRDILPYSIEKKVLVEKAIVSLTAGTR